MHHALAGLCLAAVDLALVHLELDDGAKTVDFALYHSYLRLAELQDVVLYALKFRQHLVVGLQLGLQLVNTLHGGGYDVTLGQFPAVGLYAFQQQVLAVGEKLCVRLGNGLGDCCLQTGYLLVELLKLRV